MLKKLNFVFILLAMVLSAAGLHAQTLAADKTSLTFSGLAGTQTVQSQTVNISGASGTFFTASAVEQNATSTQWLKVSAGTNAPAQFTTGIVPQAISVSADPTGLSAGTYTGYVTVSANTLSGSASVTVNVSFSVTSIGVNPSNLTFTFQTGNVPPATSVSLSGASTGFTATVTSTCNCVEINPTSGTSPGAITVTFDPVVSPTLAAGTYTGTITVTPTGSGNNPAVVIPINITVSAAPTVTLSASTVQLNYQNGGANNQQVQQTITLTSNSSTPQNFSFSEPQPFPPNVIVNPISGTIPANGSTSITISYNGGAINPNTYSGTLVLNAPGTSPNPQNITVNLLVSNSPLLSVSNAGLNFNYELSGTAPAAQTVTAVSSAVLPTSTTGQMPVTASVSSNASSWLTIALPSGTPSSQVATTTGTPISVAVNGSTLLPGKYTGTITFTGNGAGNGAQTVTVNLTVANDPTVVANTGALLFAVQSGQALVSSSQTSQTVSISSSTGAPLNYAATFTPANGGPNFVSLTGATSGTTPGSFTVTAVPGTLAAGVTYTGTLTITATNAATGNPALGSPLSIPVSFYLYNTPLLVPSLPGNPASPPTFTAQAGSAISTPQAITLQSSNPAVTLNYSVQVQPSSPSWLVLAGTNGSTAAGSNTLSVYVAPPPSLAPGVYTANLAVTATNPDGTPVADATAANPMIIPVTLRVTAGSLVLSPTSLSFTQVSGGTAPPTQTVQVTSSTSTPLNFSVSAVSSPTNWLSVTPTTGATGTSLTVTANGSQLSPGNYTGIITLSSQSAAPVTLQVTLTVTTGTISASPTSLTFTQVTGASAPPAQTVNVTGSVSGIPYTVTTSTKDGATWLSATPTTGSTAGAVQISVNAGSLAVGQYTGTVTIAGTNANTVTVGVTFNVVTGVPLTVNPAGPLTFNAVIGGTTPASQTVQLTSTGSAPFTAAATTKDGANWLSVSPTNGTATSTATPLTVAVNPTSLAAGNYTGTVTISSPNSSQPVAITVNLSVVAIPPPVIVKVANAASYISNAISPGEIVILGGTGIGPASTAYGTLSNNSLSTNVGNTQVFFDNTPAPIYYATATQTAVFVPYEIAGRPTTTITVKFQGITSNALTYTVASAVPGIFTQNQQGSGPGSILNQDNSINGPNNGAAAGSVVQVFMTGEGQTSPNGVTGQINCPAGQACSISQLPVPLLPVTATIGGVAAKVYFAGEAPGGVSGFFQVDVIVPNGLTPGPQPLVINIGSNPTQTGVTVQTK